MNWPERTRNEMKRRIRETINDVDEGVDTTRYYDHMKLFVAKALNREQFSSRIDWSVQGLNQKQTRIAKIRTHAVYPIMNRNAYHPLFQPPVLVSGVSNMLKSEMESKYVETVAFQVGLKKDDHKKVTICEMGQASQPNQGEYKDFAGRRAAPRQGEGHTLHGPK